MKNLDFKKIGARAWRPARRRLIADHGGGVCSGAAADPLNSGDTAWMITSSALVLLMTIPGLALFYAGMVRKKNILATAAQSFGATCIITVLWMIIGYSVAFTTNADCRAQPISSAASITSCSGRWA